jgi:hypothetical protein
VGATSRAKATCWPDVIVVVPPLLDANLGLNAVPKPLQAQRLVAELAVERLVGAILPGLPWIDEGGFDLRRRQPTNNRGRDKFGAIVTMVLALTQQVRVKNVSV